MVNLIVGTQVDDNSIRNASNEIQRRFDKIGMQTGDQFMSKFSEGAASASPKIQKAMNVVEDATSKLRVEQSRLDDLFANGESNRTKLISQSERVAKARRDEALAVQRAAQAHKDYGESGSNAAQAFMDGLRNGSGFAGAGRDAADSFTGGFGGAASIARLGAAAGPIGVALAGVAALGVVAGKQLASAVVEGMGTIQMQDQFQAKMGLDEASMAQYADAAGRAYASNFGTSVADNLSTAQVALRARLIDPSSSQAEVQAVVEQLQGLSMATEATTGEVSRSIATLMRNGLAGSIAEASDIITAGFQKGLDVSGDWLDTVNEYSTQARKFGLDASQYMTLLSQGLEGGARDTDKVADALKEFSIRAVDGSKTTREGFEALGYSADDMAGRFASGGQSAKDALAATFDALKRVDDPMQQALIWQRLFGTQWEDMGDAVNRFDLDPAKNEFRDLAGVSKRSVDDASDNFRSEWEKASRAVEQRFTDLKTSLAGIFTPFLTDLAKSIDELFRKRPELPPGAPGTPALQYGPQIVTPGPAVTPPFTAIPGTNPLDILLGGVNPATLGSLSTPDYYKQLYPNAGVNGPQAGTPTRILTDAQAEAEKEAEKQRKELAKLPEAPVLPYDTSVPGWAAGLPMSAQNSYVSAHNDLLTKQARADQLRQSSVATQADIQKAENDVIKAGQQLVAAQESLANARQSAYDKETKQLTKHVAAMEDIGAKLDNDFGLSDGLPGLAENIIKFVADLAAAPLLGPLSVIKQAAPDQGGSGLIGMLAAQNPRYQSNVPEALAYPGAGYPAGYASGASGTYMRALPSGYPGDASLLGAVPAGRYAQTQAADLTQGLGDCSSAVEDLVNILDGRSTAGRSMATGNAAEWLTSRGFMPGMGGPGDFRVGFNSGHMQATLPGGTPFNWGSDSSAANRGIGGTGAFDPSFTDHYYRPESAIGYSLPSLPSSGISTTPADIGMPSPGYQPLTGPALTNPGLSALTPLAPPAGSGVGAGGGPFGPFPQAAPGAYTTSLIPGQVNQGSPGGAGSGSPIGGIPMAAATAAASTALDALAPGTGAAASLVMQLANRAIGYGAGMGANALSGLFETFSLSGTGGMTDPMKTLPGRLLSGLAQARPQLPNTAAQKQQPQPGEQPQSQGAPPGPGGGPLVNIEAVHQAPGQEPDSVANSVANQFRSYEYSGGFHGR